MSYIKHFIVQNKFRIVFMLLLFALILTAFIYALKPRKTLAVLNPVDFDKSVVDDSLLFVKQNHKIADFELVDQLGRTFTRDSMAGKIVISDFFFSTCPTICPVMTKNMQIIQEAFKNDEEILLIGHSVTPEYDTPEVLKKYATKNGIDYNKWRLLTGDRKTIFDLGRKSYFTVKTTELSHNYTMIHTENIMIVDKLGRLRGRSYDGTKKEEIEELIEDVRALQENN